MENPLSQRVTAELIGTAMLLTAVVGSGVMGERLAGGNAAIALLANTLATRRGVISADTYVRSCLGRAFQSCRHSL